MSTVRTLIVGIVVLILWALFSVWIYIDKLMPDINIPAIEKTVSETRNTPDDPNTLPEIEDSISQPVILKPGDILIYFDFDKATPKINSQIENGIIDLNKWIDENPESEISITGHTDSTGTSVYNMNLGLRRGLAVQEYLRDKGADASKTKVDSKGEDQPVNNQATEEERSKNRRAVITILK